MGFLWQRLILVVAIFAGSFAYSQEGEPLNRELKPEDRTLENELFRDMVVIQNKAMNKSGRFLLSSYAALDFSDGPYTMWAWNINPGYAISDFWEVYISFVPVFYNSERSIVKKVNDIVGTITASKAKYQYGAEILW